MTAITINLPEPQLSQVKQAAIGLNIPESELITNMVLSAFPPVDDVPEEMKVELLQMAWIDTPSLWRIAKGQMDSDEQARLNELVQQKIQGSLTKIEENELEELQRQYGRATLRKAPAYMLLSLRGGKPVLQKH